ncbi:right-handed parallel beta-helix repeat-containing protein [Natrinema halophilum]|uniref:Right-handed parallel beta-helix repeat-containing protein n=1 Tax=Natrinema halophilum TaxID=1699371 RepID=A0A7D5GG91_9EURY|nr:right-handed parallel beta-helix repeat-containing protein [Natrinema halophilum]QLG48147.1 right-handed parallel beta-helix repeat-containing protein [Natrinema halophilum]
MKDDNQSDQSTSAGDTTRRSYVRLLGSLGIGGALAGVAGTTASGAATAQTGMAANGISVSDSGTMIDATVAHLDFDNSLSATEAGDDIVRIDADTNPNIVDVREDLGIEPEQDDLLAAIEDHYSSFKPTERNHRYEVPPGTWYVETDNIHLEAHEYFELVGCPFATLKVTDQDVDRLMTVGTLDASLPHAQRTIMCDLQVDIRGDYDAGIARWYTYKYGHMENVSMRGRRDKYNSAYGGDRHTILVDGVRSFTTNIIRGCNLNNGDTKYDRSTHVGHAIPFSSDTYNHGTNYWEGCQVSDYIDNGIYVSGDDGQNIVTGCHVQNCAGAGIRIGPNDHVRNCQITMTDHPGYPWSGLWLENGGGQLVSQVLVNNQIRKNTEIIRLTQDGPARLTDVHINDGGTDGRAIRVDDNDAAPTIFEGCTITDRSEPTISDYAVYVQSSNVTFSNCDFHIASQSPMDRHGVFVTNGDDAIDRLSLDSCTIDTDGASLRFDESGESHNVTCSRFGGLVMSDSDTTLSRVLWVGNRHGGDTRFRGQRRQWEGDFNFGFDV